MGVFYGMGLSPCGPAETCLIKLLSLFGPFQQDTFIGLKWRYALLATLAGNACSYYVGTLLAASSGA